MGKFAKGSLITAGILLAIGFVLCFISVTISGGRILLDKEALGAWGIKIDALEDAISVIDSDSDDESGRWFADWDEYVTSELTLNGETVFGTQDFQFNAQEIQKLNISLGAGRFIIEEKNTADGVIDFSVKGIGTCKYSVENGTLKIDAFSNIEGIHLNEANNVITLKVPEGIQFEDVSTEIGAGIMKASGFEAKNFSIELGAGEIEMEKMRADTFTAEIGAGQMNADDIQIVDANVTVNMGRCELEGNISGNLELECDMGTLELELDGKSTDHNYQIECDAGNISMEGLNASVLAGERTIDNGADSTFSIVCNMGTIEIDFED